MQTLKKHAFGLAVVAWFTLLSGCGRKENEYQKLLHENEQLKAEVEKGKQASPDSKAGKGDTATPADLDADINALWTQRFDDNEFRSRQRLADKTIRLTGTVDSVTESSISMIGDSKRFGSVRMTVNFNPSYASKSRAGLASLERGLEVTVQGKFVYERTSLIEATFVDRKSGKMLSSADIATLARERRIDPAAKP
jgi:hypothetical protein